MPTRSIIILLTLVALLLLTSGQAHSEGEKAEHQTFDQLISEGIKLFREKNYLESEKVYRAAIEESKGTPNAKESEALALQNLSILYETQGKQAEANECSKRRSELIGESKTVVKPIGFTGKPSPQQLSKLNNEAVSLLKKSQFNTAIEKFEAITKLQPEYSLARENLKIAYWNLAVTAIETQDMQSLRKAYDGFCKIPDHANKIPLKLAIIAFELGNRDDALSFFKQGKPGSYEGFDYWQDYGFVAADFNQYKLAADSYAKALELNPKDACTYNNLSSALLEQGEIEKALQYQIKSLSLLPKHAEHFANLAYLEAELGLQTEATKHADETLALAESELNKNPTDFNAKVAKIYALMTKKQYPTALEETNKLSPVMATLRQEKLNLLAKINLQIGKKQNALNYFDSLLKLSASNSARFERGKLLKSMGRGAEGDAEMKAAMDAHYVDPESLKGRIHI